MFASAPFRALFTAALFFVAVHSASAFDNAGFLYDARYVNTMAAKGKLNEAIKYWENLRTLYGGAQGHYENELGNLYSNAGRYDQAEKAYLAGIALNGKYPRPYIGLSFVYLDQGRYDDAEHWAKRAVEEFPSWWLGYTTIGHIEWKQKSLASAKKWLNKSLEIEPHAETYWFLAIVSYQMKEWQAAIDALDAAIDLDKSYMAEEIGVRAAALSLAHVGRYQDAYRMVDTLKARNPNVKESDIESMVDTVKTLEHKNPSVQ